MAAVIPRIPTEITVHLGRAQRQRAANVTVPFVSYIKNVASSEIYPTWEPSRAAGQYSGHHLLRPEPGATRSTTAAGAMPFEITSTTAYDQKFIQGRNIFENISPDGGRDFRRLYPPSGLCRAPGRQVLQRHHLHLRRPVPVGQPGAGPAGAEQPWKSCAGTTATISSWSWTPHIRRISTLLPRLTPCAWAPRAATSWRFRPD